MCTALRVLIRDSVELQYIIELAADGMEDGVDCPLSIAERLARLLQLRGRWRAVDWAGTAKVSAPALTKAYEFADGVYASSRVQGAVFRSRHLALTWLPTLATGGGGESRVIEREDVGLSIRDFAMDPSQDLIVLLQVEDPQE